MNDPIYATFDGEVFRPEGAVTLEPNTRVRVTLEQEPANPVTNDDPYAFLHILMAANLDGPPDWSVRFRERYGDRVKEIGRAHV